MFAIRGTRNPFAEDNAMTLFPLSSGDLAGLTALVRGERFGESVTGTRTLSGAGNNEAQTDYGAADQPFIRLTEARYGAAEYATDPATGQQVLVNRGVNPIFDGLDPRAISNLVAVQGEDTPDAANEANIFFMAFGQYVDHGLDFVAKGGSGTLEIGGPGSSRAPGSDNPADLTRASVSGFDADGTPLHINKISNFVDQNQAYGSNELVGIFLREPDGNQGVGAMLMKGPPDSSNPAFNLLPSLRQLIEAHWNNDTRFVEGGFETTFRTYYAGLVDQDGVINQAMVSGLYENFMGSGQPLLLDVNPFINPLDHVVAGDGRVNENVSLTAVHTIWARNHDFHVENLQAQGFAGTVEELYQAAKLLNIAEYQRVVFDEFADALLGGMRGRGTHGHDEYDPKVDPGVSHEFAGAAYRFGHSLIGDTLTVLDANGDPTNVQLYDAFLNPGNDGEFVLPIEQLRAMGYDPQPGYRQLGAGAVIGGTIAQAAAEVDTQIVDAVRNDLVRISADLFSLNLLRGRDIGLGTMNQVRAELAASDDPYVREAVGYAGDLSPYASWEDFQARNNLTDELIAKFRLAYPDLVLQTPKAIAAFQATNPGLELVDGNTVRGIDRVDLYAGGLAEKHINGGMVGQTFWVILHEQFDRLQQGDRFYYTDQLDNFDLYETLIDGQGFTDIVARVTGLAGLPEDVFFVDDEDDPANHAPILAVPLDDKVVKAGAAFEIALPPGSFTDLDAADTLTYSARLADGGPLPSWLSFSPSGLLFSGTPPADAVGVLELRVTVRDNAAATATDSFVLTIDDGWTVIEGTDGPELLNGTTGDDRMLGLGGADTLRGGGGDDELAGGEGNDSLHGGAGNDTLLGGDGNDIYSVGDAGDVVVELADEGYDRVIASISYTLSDHVERLSLTGTADLNGTGNALGNRLDGTAGANILAGGEGNDTLYGGGGDDELAGGEGSDALYGGAGNDTLLGGDGNDIYSLGDAGDVVVELADEGYDRVIASISYTLSDHVERLSLTGTADLNGTGNALGNRLDGTTRANILAGGDGNDTLYGGGGEDELAGGEGSDSLHGGAGNDTLLGGDGNDIYSVDDAGDVVVELADGGYDRVVASISYTLDDHVERLSLTGTADLNGTGNALGNRLDGTTGANILAGGDGNDTLYGGAGDDTLLGGDGNDLVDGGLGAEILTGGDGADIFLFRSAVEANGDVITDFSMAQGDRIDLRPIDANVLIPGNQAVTWIGDNSFGGVAGQMRFASEVLEGDLDGDGAADFQIALTGVASLTVTSVWL
jgi:Ca2+-binding RTX toxin-like protein